MNHPLIRIFIVLLISFCTIPTVNAQDLTQGLVSAWEFDETSGSITNDELDNNNGTNLGASVNQTGKIGRCFYFNGINDGIEISSNSSLNFSTEMTISAWINPEQSQTAYISIKTNDLQSNSDEFEYRFLIFNNNKVAFSVSSDGTFANYKEIQSIQNINIGAWNHVVGVFTNSTLYLYLNGEQIASPIPTGFTNLHNGIANLNIGCRKDGSDDNYKYFYKGNIDQIALWNKALTDSEVSILHNSGNGLAFSQWTSPLLDLIGGTISPPSKTIISGEVPGTISSTAGASGGTGNYVYQWEQSTNDGSLWTPISGASQTSYTPSALTETTWFQRRVVSTTDTAYSNTSKITVNTTTSESTNSISHTNRLTISATEVSVTWTEDFSHNNYFLFVRAWTEETLHGKTLQIQNGIYDFSKTVSGFSLKLKNPEGYLTYYAIDTIPPVHDNTFAWEDTLTTIATKTDISGLQPAITGDESLFDAWDKNRADDFNGEFTSLIGIPADLSDGDDVGIVSETDPLFNTWNKSDGINITENQISDLGNYIETEADGLTTNEGSLTVGVGTDSTSIIQSNTSGSVNVTLKAGSNIALNEADNTITISGTTGQNYSVQTLSGTTPTLDVTNGLNAQLTLSSNTTITLSNLVAGQTGNVTVTNGVTIYTLTFAGYTYLISPGILSNSDEVTTSGGSKTDCFSWYYDGTQVLVNGTLDYQ